MGNRGELKKTQESFHDLREDILESGFQQAVKWRHRIKAGTPRLSDSSRDVMFEHVDNLIRFATAQRGRRLTR